MENFIRKVFSQQPVNTAEVHTFVVDYCKLMKKSMLPGDLQAIMLRIQMGFFDLKKAVKIAAHKLDIQVYTLYSNNGFIIKEWIQ